MKNRVKYRYPNTQGGAWKMPPAEELDSADLRRGDSPSVESCQELLGTDEGTLARKISPGIPVFTLFCTGQ